MILRAIGTFGTWVLLPIIFFLGLAMIAKMGRANAGEIFEFHKEIPSAQTTSTVPK